MLAWKLTVVEIKGGISGLSSGSAWANYCQTEVNIDTDLDFLRLFL